MADFFVGKVTEREYSQIVAKEREPAVIVDGVVTSWRNVLYYSKTKEQRFRAEGLSYSQAHETSAITVADPSGGTYTVTPVASVVDGSSGTTVFQQEAVEVMRGHMSPRLWWLEVVRRGSALYQKIDGGSASRVVAPPAWTGY